MHTHICIEAEPAYALAEPLTVAANVLYIYNRLCILICTISYTASKLHHVRLLKLLLHVNSHFGLPEQKQMYQSCRCCQPNGVFRRAAHSVQSQLTNTVDKNWVGSVSMLFRHIYFCFLHHTLAVQQVVPCIFPPHVHALVYGSCACFRGETPGSKRHACKSTTCTCTCICSNTYRSAHASCHCFCRTAVSASES